MKTKALKICAFALVLALVLSPVASALSPYDTIFSAILFGGGSPLLATPVLSTPYLRSVIAAKKEAPDADKAEQPDRGHFAYVVSAEQKYNKDTDLYYAVLELINETGSFEVLTVDDVENYNFLPVLTPGFIGNIATLKGRFIQFDMRKTDKIQKLEPRRSAVSKSFSTADGFYLVNIIAERGGVISFYDTSADITIGAPAQNAAFDDDGYAIICIDGDQFSGEMLIKVSKGETELYEGCGNAVIQMEGGKVVRVFSFVEGFEI